MKNEQKNETKEMVQNVNEVAKAPKKNTVKSLLESENMKVRIQELLKDRASSFITSVIQLVQQDKALAECEPNSVIGAAMTAASLDLPINKNLGYAYVIPYNVKQPDGSWLKVAQFQLG